MKNFTIIKKVQLLISGLLICSLSLSQTYVSGTIDGDTWVLDGSPYILTGDVLVTSLEIHPGVNVLANGNYIIEVVGILSAIGSIQDSINFSKTDSINGWKGIFFNYSVPGSELSYCKIEYSLNAGLNIDSSNPIIRNCRISNNSNNNFGGGGGICSNADIMIEECIVSNNSISKESYAHGGGISSSGHLKLNNCKILNNTVYTYGSSTNGSYSNGGGIYAAGPLTITNTYIDGNISHATHSWGNNRSKGGGIYFSANLDIINSVITNNVVIAGTSKQGGGIFANGDEISSIINCVISDNIYHGIYIGNDTVNIINSIFWENSVSQISGEANVYYCDIQNGFNGVGNININPLFIDDYYHISAYSPCVDVGNPDTTGLNLPLWDMEGDFRIWDGDGNGVAIIDMGSYEVGAPIYTEIINHDLIDPKVINIQNYPNPFSTKTTIKFSNPNNSNYKLSVFSISGNKVFEMENIKSDKIEFDRGNLPKGIYIVELKGEKVFNNKMIIIK